ncbi:hypothetical protein ACUM6W_02735 [Acinetobacter tandoii]|uniref:hypothetical protein n=1 Tax=Acinetobacter tandoii TaxID=202954 RepID=UPI00404540BF
MNNNIRERINSPQKSQSKQLLLTVLNYTAENTPFPKRTSGIKLYLHPAIFALILVLLLSSAFLIVGGTA